MGFAGFGVWTRHYFYLSRKGVHHLLCYICSLLNIHSPSVYSLICKVLSYAEIQCGTDWEEYKEREMTSRRAFRHNKNHRKHTWASTVPYTHILWISLSHRWGVSFQTGGEQLLSSCQGMKMKQTPVWVSLLALSLSFLSWAVRGCPGQRVEGREGLKGLYLWQLCFFSPVGEAEWTYRPSVQSIQKVQGRRNSVTTC